MRASPGPCLVMGELGACALARLLGRLAPLLALRWAPQAPSGAKGSTRGKNKFWKTTSFIIFNCWIIYSTVGPVGRFGMNIVILSCQHRFAMPFFGKGIQWAFLFHYNGLGCSNCWKVEFNRKANTFYLLHFWFFLWLQNLLKQSNHPNVYQLNKWHLGSGLSLIWHREAMSLEPPFFARRGAFEISISEILLIPPVFILIPPISI